MLNISSFHNLNQDSSIVITQHATHRLFERGITMDDVKNCFSTGTIIEQYEADKPLPSCLIFGYTRESKPLHVIASYDDCFIYLISAYYPSSEFWYDDYKTRRK